VGVDRESAEFIGNKQTNKQTHLLANTYTDTQLYISVNTLGPSETKTSDLYRQTRSRARVQVFSPHSTHA